MVVAIRSFHRSRSSGVMVASSVRSVTSATAGWNAWVAEGSAEAIGVTLAGGDPRRGPGGAGPPPPVPPTEARGAPRPRSGLDAERPAGRLLLSPEARSERYASAAEPH